MGKCRFSFVGDHLAQGLVVVPMQSGRDFAPLLIGYARPSAPLLAGLKAGKSYTGKWADLILFTLENGKMVIQKAIIAGNAVCSAKGN